MDSLILIVICKGALLQGPGGGRSWTVRQLQEKPCSSPQGTCKLFQLRQGNHAFSVHDLKLMLAILTEVRWNLNVVMVFNSFAFV